MPHNVLFGQVVDGDAVYILQHAHRLGKSGSLSVRQVGLRQVAGHDDLGAEPHTRQEHLDLLRRRVLCLVQDDERIVQRASAHIGKRCHLDCAPFRRPLVPLGSHHFVERVVQGAQVRIDLGQQVTGQEAQPFACLNRGTGQNNARNLLLPKCLDSHGNSQKGLARSGRSDAQYNRILPDSLHVLGLSGSLGFDRLSFCRQADNIRAERRQLGGAPFRHGIGNIPDGLLVERVAQAEHIAQVPHRRGGGIDSFR